MLDIVNIFILLTTACSLLHSSYFYTHINTQKEKDIFSGSLLLNSKGSTSFEKYVYEL